MKTLVLATANPDKVKELQDVLGGAYDLRPRPTDLADTFEDGDTLEYNATKKAREVSDFTGLPALADDSGLFVDFLGGAPGVYSARYAGENVTYDDNVTKMLQELDGVEQTQRGAQFRTTICYLEPGKEPVLVTGEMQGYISTERTGENGFGYDPIFVPVEGDGRSYAEMSHTEKNAMSHRTKAVQALLGVLG